MHDLEKKAYEQRLLQANQRNLTGMDGKIGTVLRNLGKPILRNESDWFDTNEFDSPYDTESIDVIPSVDEMGFSSTSPSDIPVLEGGGEEIGMHFDGLQWGMHLEIKYLNDTQEFLLTYGGYPVYCEVSGELTCFVPGDWEDKINTLFSHAKKIENERHKVVAVENRREAKRAASSLLDHLRKYWGV